MSKRRYPDARFWLRVTVETHMAREWEVLWAKDLLFRWAGTGRELRVAVPQVAAKPIQLVIRSPSTKWSGGQR